MPASYKDLDVWKVSMLLIAEVYRITANLPRDERYGLTAQMRRAAISIPNNIAEGYGRATRGEYLNQLSVARGSVNELETEASVCKMLGFLAASELQEFDGFLNRVKPMLGKLRLRLSKPRR